jgi:sulfide:quinone oxidoreductase
MNAPGPRLVPLTPELSVAGRLERADIEALARAGVRTIINNRPDGEDPGQLPAAEARRLAEAEGLQYHHVPITAASLSRADVDAFAAALGSAPGPIVAHCRSGTRSALLHALVRLREGADPFALVAEAAKNGIDITSLPAVAARLR